MKRVWAIVIIFGTVRDLPTAHGQSQSPESPAQEKLVTQELARHAKALEPLVGSNLAKQFLMGVAALSEVAPRTILRDKESRKWYSANAAKALPTEAQEKLEARTLTSQDYYFTKYGSPLAYVRPLEILGKAGFSTANGKRILDFGYGTVGHLRLLAGMGANATGVDVDSYLTALYCDPGDQGSVRGPGGNAGQIRLIDGSFPGDEATRKAVGGDYDLFISKNTLKNGYIHPSEPVDPRKLVHLGVDDQTFVKTMFDSLKSGGWVLIYNICPAPAKPGQPYIPWADGRCPFSQELLEKTGFRVVAFDQNDDVSVRAMGRALEWHVGDGAMDLEGDLFAVYTLLQRP